MDVGDHDYLRRIFPHFVAWKEQYGGPFLFWLGTQPRICISDYDSVKQILSNKYGHFVKNDAHPAILSMIGKGLVLVDGKDWVRHRRVLTPAFSMDKLKMMTETITSCAECLIKEWEDQASNSKNKETEVEFSKQFQELTADVICRTAFGSGCKEGKEVFHAQKQLQAIAIATLLNMQLPGFKYLPTKMNRCKWMLEKKLKNMVMQIIRSRIASEGNGYGDDLLGVMLDACYPTEQGKKRDELTLNLSVDEIIDECKTFFFAGHETTSHLLTWTMFLLSVYPEWQDRLREEVLRECGKENPNADMLSKLKTMTMVLLETLRLYSPVMFMYRKPITNIQLGRLQLPGGTTLVIPIPMLHRDKEVWGDDADQFDPLRFQNGVTKAAKIPHALMGFSIGPRSCIGQSFAILEAKSVMAMILRKFSFTLSPKYIHAPADMITLQPKFGLPILLRALEA
uniref:Cytochrome P450 n=2 Tax=Oryza brachyantha TaxID=4533 RepID=J3LP47_ORYBR